MSNLVQLPLDRYKAERDAMEPAVFERRRRRGIVDTMVRGRMSYWGVIDWLGAWVRRRFLSLDEAARFFAEQMRTRQYITYERAVVCYVVARYFARKRADFWKERVL